MLNSKRTAFPCFVIFLLSIFAMGQNKSISTSLPSVLPSKDVLSMTRWAVSSGELTCIVWKRPSNAAPAVSLSTKTMDVYRKQGSTTKRIFEFETPDSLLNMYPLGELDARLITTWTGGSAYHIRGFAYVDGRVRQVLDASSRGMPEVIIDENEQEAILVTHMEMMNGQWGRNPDATTDIYRWNGKAYDKVGTVPWTNRLKCASKEPCALLNRGSAH
jgi:hypothetical protein